MENDILQLAIYVVAGFIIGIILHKWIMPLLARLATKTKLKTDDLIVSIISKWVISWFVALGLFIGLKHIEINDRYHNWLLNGLMIFLFIFNNVDSGKGNIPYGKNKSLRNRYYNSFFIYYWQNYQDCYLLYRAVGDTSIVGCIDYANTYCIRCWRIGRGSCFAGHPL